MKITHKLIISYIGIILITSLLWMYFKKQNRVQEGADVFKEIKDLIDDIKNGVKTMTSGIQNMLQDIIKLKEMGINVQNGIKKVGSGITQFESATRYAVTQGVNDIQNISDKTVDVSNKAFTDLNASWTSFWDCIAKLQANWASCFGFYTIHLILQLLYYLSVGFPIYLIDLLTAGFINLEPTANLILGSLTDMTFKMSGDTITSVYNKCYYCNITPMTNVSATPIIEATQKMHNNFKYEIPLKFTDSIQSFIQGKSQLASAIGV